MAFLQLQFDSEVLQLSTTINVILPKKREQRKELPVLWLLHGLSDDHTGWTRWTSIERYVRNKELCVVMPAVDRSFYTDMAYGNKYFTYLTEELPEALSTMFGLSRKREDNYVAGLSMGGYGAFKVGLNYPDRYCAAASLSGALDMMLIHGHDESGEIDGLMKLVYGSAEAFNGSHNDLVHMAKVRAEEGNLPRLYMCCGKEDFLYPCNQVYLNHLRSLEVPVTYEEEDGYKHSWDYWDLKIQRILDWIEA